MGARASWKSFLLRRVGCRTLAAGSLDFQCLHYVRKLSVIAKAAIVEKHRQGQL